MKFFRIFLFSCSLLSFQANAMEGFVDLTNDEDKTRTPKLRLVDKSKSFNTERDINIEHAKKPCDEKTQIEFPDDIFLYFLHFPGTKGLGRTSRNLHKLFCHPIFNRTMLINSAEKFYEALKSRNPSGDYELPSVPNIIVLSGEMPTPNQFCLRYRYDFQPGGIEKLLTLFPNLRSLELTNIKMENKECSVFAEVLSTNTSLTSLTLHNNSLGPEDGVVLAEILKTNSTLKLLSLHKDDIDFEGGMDFNNDVPTPHINQYCNKIGTVGGIAFSDALKTNTSLTSLNLWGQKIEEKGTIAIDNGLKINTSLKSLNLSNNMIGDMGAIAIGHTLITNNCLTSLNLGWNNIGNKGATVIWNALKINASLKLLSLGKTNFDFEKNKEIIDALKVNASLISLDLSQGRAITHPMGNDGAKKIIDVLKNNSTLTSLNLWGHKISQWWKIKINKCLANNQNKSIEQNSSSKLNLKSHKKKGRELKLSLEQAQALKVKVKAGEKKVNIAKEFGIHPYTINNYLDYYEDDQFLHRDSNLTRETHFIHGMDNKKVSIKGPLISSNGGFSTELKEVNGKKRTFEQVIFNPVDTDQRERKISRLLDI